MKYQVTFSIMATEQDKSTAVHNEQLPKPMGAGDIEEVLEKLFVSAWPELACNERIIGIEIQEITK